MNIFFSNIRILNPAQKLDKRMNLWAKDGTIEYLNMDKPNLDNDTEHVDGSEMVCTPGFFDMHVHFCEPGYEYKENMKTGTQAAANGGFTGVLIMPDTDPVIDNAVVVEYIKQIAKDMLVDINISAALTKGREGTHLSPMIELYDHGVKMLTDEPASVQSPEVMRRVFDYAGTKDMLISQNCQEMSLTEDFSMNEGALSDKLGLKGYPFVAEEMIVARDILLSEYCDKRRFHVSHLSTQGSVRTVREAKKRGLRISSEVAPHYFVLDDRKISTFDTNYKVNPPLRRQRDIDAIFEGLADGTIDCIVSDHKPHALHEKEVEFEISPYGIIGLETLFGLCMTYLVHKGHIDLNTLIEKITVNPRKLLKLPQVMIEEGREANLTIVAPNENWTVDREQFKSKAQNTPFDGYPLKGKPKYAINNGQVYRCRL